MAFKMNWWKILLIILVIIVFILYLILLPIAKNRSMKKQNSAIDQMHSQLKIGDKIVLIDGITGTVKQIMKDDVRVEIAPKVIISIKKMGIAAIDNGDDKNENKSMATAHSTVKSK